MDMIGIASGDNSDESLVLAARSGQKQALDELAGRYLGLVYAVALGRLNDRDLAEELTQEVFLRVCLLIDRIQNPALFSHWITRVTRNLAIDWQRRGSRASRLLPMVSLDDISENVEDSKVSTARDEAAAKEHASALHEVLARLRPEERELLLLHYMEGLSQGEIAQRLGVDKSTVSRHLDRSVKRMRGLFDHVLRQMATGLRPRTELHRRVVTVTAAAIVLPQATKSAMAATVAATLDSTSTGIVGKLAGSTAGSGITSAVRAALLILKSGGTKVGVVKGIGLIVLAAAVGTGTYQLTNSGESGSAPSAISTPASTGESGLIDFRAVAPPGVRVVLRAENTIQSTIDMPPGSQAPGARGGQGSRILDEIAVTAQPEPGGMAVQLEFLKSEGELDFGNQKVSFSSARPLPSDAQRSPAEKSIAPIAEASQARIGKKLVAHVKTSGKVERIDGDGQPTRAITEAVEKTLKTMVQPVVLPDHPVKVGDTWQKTETQQLGSSAMVGDLIFHYECRFVGWETLGNRRVAVIESRGTVSANKPATGRPGQPATQIADSSTRSRTTFCPELGVVIGAESEQAIAVNMPAPGTIPPAAMRYSVKGATKVSLVSAPGVPGA